MKDMDEQKKIVEKFLESYKSLMEFLGKMAKCDDIDKIVKLIGIEKDEFHELMAFSLKAYIDVMTMSIRK